MTRSTRLRLLALAAVPALLLAAPRTAAWANMAAPPDPRTLRAGTPLTEPMGGLRDVFIEHETLTFDLRPIEEAKLARVEAVYRVRNDGPARTLDLLFVADGLTSGATTVSVDGRPVARRPGTADELPPNWRAPATTPALDSGEPLPYAPGPEGTLSFQVQLAAGRHEIRVSYPVRATAYSVNDLTPIWQFGYVLAPARSWGGFGRLEVRVEAPRGWRVATEPALREEDGAWVGRWDGLPADAISLSLQRPPPSSGPWYLLWAAASAVGLALIGWLGWVIGRALGRRGRSAAWALLPALGLSAVWTIASMLLYSNVPELVRWQAGELASDHAIRSLRYGVTILGLMMVLVILPVGLITVQVCAVLGRRRATRG
jgi:hypothetical protein